MNSLDLQCHIRSFYKLNFLFSTSVFWKITKRNFFVHISPTPVTIWTMKLMTTDSRKPLGTVLPQHIIVFSTTQQNRRIYDVRQTEKDEFDFDLCPPCMNCTRGELHNTGFTKTGPIKRQFVSLVQVVFLLKDCVSMNSSR